MKSSIMVPEYPASSPDMTVVIPVYKNADTLEELHVRLRDVLDRAGIRFEIIFVEDACPQKSFIVLKRMAGADSRISVLAMDRNIGQQKAIMAGIDYADGRTVVIMDADLQDPPESIPALFEKLNEGYDVVFAGRRGKYEADSRLFTSRLYKWTLHLLTGVPRDAGLFLIVRRETVRKLTVMESPYPHLVAMFGALGAHSTSIPVERAQRPSGISAYTSWMRLRMGLMAAFWALGWRIGIRLHARKPPTSFPVRERIGHKFQ